MVVHKFHCLVVAACMSVIGAPQARAQWAVIDAPAIVQLIQEVQAMTQQLATTRLQLIQAQQTLASMTGDRKMELLLGGSQRNYLPTNWLQLMGVLQGGGAYPGLSADMRTGIAGNSVLSVEQLSRLSTGDQQLITAERQAGALRQALTEEALSNASGRFASLQVLISAISSAKDQKAILDLQARISAELGMLQNEQTKLLILGQATQAIDAVNLQREREQVIAGYGNFSTRFQPVP